MASGHVTALIEAEHIAAPTNTALVKKVLATRSRPHMALRISAQPYVLFSVRVDVRY